MDQARRTYLQRRLKGWEMELSLWLADLLVTMQQVCGSGRKGKLHDWLDAELTKLALYVMGIVLIHTSLRVQLGAPVVCYDPRRASCGTNLRGSFGGDLRRALKGRSFAERAANIRRALDNLETLITRMVRRLRKGLSRAAAAHTRVAMGGAVALVPMLRSAAIACADTS